MYSLIRNSNNSKTGNMPVTYSTIADCNPGCKHYIWQTCYGLWGHVGIHWRKVSTGERGVSWREFLDEIWTLPKKTLWRHNIAGDLPRQKYSKLLSRKRCIALAKAARRTKPFTYCHHEKVPHNLTIISEMNEMGFTVNLSTDTLKEAALWYKHSTLPIVTLLPKGSPKVQEVEGVKIIRCPAEYSSVKCAPVCAHTMCGNPDREWVIGFTPHGTKANDADVIARGG